MERVPAELAAFLGGADDDVPTLDAPDTLDKFLSDARLAGCIGGRNPHAHVERFAEETAGLDARAAGIYRGRAKAVVQKAAQDEWESEIDGADRLEKRDKKISRIEKTRFEGGIVVVAELDAQGRVIRTYREGEQS